MINPLPEMKWGREDEALANLHHPLSRELVAERWEGPGIPTFRRVITRLEEKLRFTHPEWHANGSSMLWKREHTIHISD
ncbi:MAG: hypothetical protein Ct9H90mP21_2590 [Methanobacteriota archaeon]|nr:MAG: hypothetical protein Ct9H90mP21_2590 [Euryarchaeota archaeon]